MENEGFRKEIRKDNIRIEDGYYRDSVERILNYVGECISEEYVEDSFKNKSNETFKVKERIYSVPGEGVIRYRTPLMLEKYFAIITTEGFDESSETFLRLEKDLETIAESNDPEELKKRFLDG
ncbi:MAG: hypothetical protein WDZ69_01390 [Candidatus Pacearchaeota archaeon]